MNDQLPDGWRWVKLGDVCESTRNVDPRREPAVQFSYVDISAIDRNAKVVRGAKRLLGADAPSRARRAVANGDVIVSTTRPNLNAVAMVPPELDGAVCSTGFCVLRAGPPVASTYLYHLVQSRGFVDEMTQKMTGASYPAVTDKVVRAFSFALPPLDEQHRIVAQLEEQLATAERARSAALAQLAAIEAMPAALLRQIFPRSPADALSVGWRWAKLGEVCDVEKGRTPKKDWYAPTGVWLVHYRDVATHGITWTAGRNTFVAPEYESSLKELEPGTVLVGADAHDPATIGKKVTLVDTVPQHASPAYFAGEMLGIRSNAQRSIEPAIVWHWLRSEAGYEEMQQNVSGGHLNVRPARNVRIPLPPVNEQHRIVQELDEQTAAIERARAAAQAQLDAIEALPTAALRLAFRP